MFTLSSPSETKKCKAKEVPMKGKKLQFIFGVIFETAWTLGASVAAGLLLPS